METLIDVLAAHLREGNNSPAQCFQSGDGWKRRTYAELWELVVRTAHRLRELGAGDGCAVAIVSRTRPEWTIVDLAAALIGAPVVPIYPTASQAQFDAIEQTTSPAMVVLDRDDLHSAAPQFRFGEEDGDLGALRRDALSDAERRAVDQAASHVLPTHTYSVVFSSGSTGAPKGCVLTHANFASVLRMASEVEAGGPDGAEHRERAFVYLPLAHVSARLQQLTTFTLGGELLYGTGGTADLLAQISELQPTYVPGVPRLFESAHLRVGGVPAKLRAVFGPRLRYALSGGAPMDPEVRAAYEAAGITLVEGYGLTETAAALALSAPHDRRAGSVGRPLPGVDLRIAADGEILARGANVFGGYLDAPEVTAEAFEGEWFRTGDLGRIDADGFLFVTGRKKNLIVTSNGKNVAPEPIENQLRIALGISDVLVVGDGRPYLTAILFAPDERETESIIRTVTGVNDDFSPPERVRKVAMIPLALTVDDGSLTASGKIIRPVLIDRLSDVIAAVYSGSRSGIIDITPSPTTAVLI